MTVADAPLSNLVERSDTEPSTAPADDVRMTNRDQLTITLRARAVGNDLTPGSLIAAPKGPGVYWVLEVWRVRRAGDKRYAIRLVCRRLSRAEVPEGAEVMPWPRDPRAPRQRRPAAPPGGQSVNPDQGEPPAALIARIRAARAADELATVVRASRVGRDDGVQHGRDYGPGLRLRPARGRRRGERLREADVEIEDGPDPARPNHTVRRARRTDPLEVLKRAGTINAREREAGEILRDAIELSLPSLRGVSLSEVHVAPWRRVAISDRQLTACRDVRRAVAVLDNVVAAVVLWIVRDGRTIRGYATIAHVRHTTVAELLRQGLRALADHYRLAVPRVA